MAALSDPPLTKAQYASIARQAQGSGAVLDLSMWHWSSMHKCFGAAGALLFAVPRYRSIWPVQILAIALARMANNVLLTFLAIDLIFAGTGGMLIAAAIIAMNGMNGTTTVGDVAPILLLSQIPATGALVNAIFVFLTFVVSLLGVLNAKDRLILRIHSWIVIFCAAFTLILGLDIWVSTLKTRSNLSNLWDMQSPAEISLLQQKFTCCGYWNSTSPPYVKDNVCTSDAAAAVLGGCVTNFSSYANGFLDLVFTGGFGIVAVDAILFLTTIVVLKDRAEKERYRRIDEKGGYAGI